MAGYICAKCEKEIEIDPKVDRIICPNCSGRILLKKRPEIAKTIKAR